MARFSNSLFGFLALFILSLQATYVPIYVMLELDVVSNNGQLNYPQKLDQQLQQLASGGVDGIMVDLWWGIVEQDGPKQYNWSPYIQIATMCQKYKLKMQAVTSFHKCGTNHDDSCFIPLPPWVETVSQSNPDIFFKDSDGHYDDEYLSFGVDDLALFQGRTPVQMYTDYVSSFLTTFSSFIPTTVTQLEIGLGPAGEMRYPGYQLQYWNFPGVGEFQCYDAYLSSQLQVSARSAGHPEWGVPPPNAGNYNSAPEATGFFNPQLEDEKENVSAPVCDPSNRSDCGYVGINQQQCVAKGCCWQPGTGNVPWCFYKSTPGLGNFQSAYGQFFLQWYQDTLVSHGDKILSNISAAVAKFGKPIQLLAKVSGVHWLYNTPSHAAEATAGYKNDQGQAYLQIAKMFAKYNVWFDFTCFEMRDSEQTSGNCRCAPEELVGQTLNAAKTYGVGYSGENALARYDQTAYNTIQYESTRVTPIKAFTYLRLGDTLLQQSNWQTFTSFVGTMHNL